MNTPTEILVPLADPLAGPGAAAAARALGEALRGAPPGAPLAIDLGAVLRVDTFGLAALGEAVRRCRREGRPVRVLRAPAGAGRLAAFLRLDRVLATEPPPAAPPPPLLERAGEAVLAFRDYMVTLLSMTAEGYRHAFVDPLRGGAVRAEQFVRQLAETGMGAVPIVVLINFMIGLILAFQMAYALRDYGATLYVARFVGITVTREIGPLIAAILVAGRSGSAMAAEIGTMVVTEEVDALEMMALRPRRFLFSPRFAALAVTVPALCIFADLAGILGGAFVGVLSYGIPAPTYYSETVNALRVTDIGSGLVKSFFFANIVAVIGCLHGIRLRGGPDAVGRAATTAVVESIIGVILFDALYTVLVYFVF
ncbi:MAG: MlaE family lipid ABC transporter permease subunit [Planctomycetes bacterium]|nr:MlaE family lipid ABC transporter permease subunit [Planctomycetota bacterium]